MRFAPTPLPGAFLINLDAKGDHRGFFARFFCEKEFAAQELETNFVQANESLSAKRGTLRGMHYQLGADAEVKVVRCIKGEIFDIILDLRQDSPTFGKSFGASLSAGNRTMMYVPRGFAHGFISLADDSEIFYLVSAFYAPQSERGVRYNDPRFKIEWPIEPVEISDKDRTWPDFDPAFHLGMSA
ncbi:MAG: dTDP-4-dehydrorhamnose 3,5-epimerase [Alphaproteobacteria bacterium]|nr:dTDP-4-dehydrorhamnose 3,5-epimerase [Alphaproteobacteria bacterium]